MNSWGFIAASTRTWVCTCLLILFTAATALAQAGWGSISGTVADPSGAVIREAQAVLLNRATGVKQQTITSAAGLYTFISLNPGANQVAASQTGLTSAGPR